jgi:hypothetical protein
MAIEVRTEELVDAADQLRRIGHRVSVYGADMDERVARGARSLDDEVACGVRDAWRDVAHAIDLLARGFETYGVAIAQVASRYADLEQGLVRTGRR